MTDAEIEELRADARRYRWLMEDADRAAQLIADAYSDWDTDEPWREWPDSMIDAAINAVSKRERPNFCQHDPMTPNCTLRHQFTAGRTRCDSCGGIYTLPLSTAERAMCDVCDKRQWTQKTMSSGIETHVCNECMSTVTDKADA